VTETIETGGELRSEPLMVRGVEAAREQVALQRKGKFHRRHLLDLLDKLGAELDSAKAERRKLEERLAAVDGPTLRARLREVKRALAATPLDYGQANAALRALFSRIIVDRDRKVLTLHWHFGGLSEIGFEPEAARARRKSERIRSLLASRPKRSAAEIAALISCSADYVRVVRSRSRRGAA
jgi:hypothetical protein